MMTRILLMLLSLGILSITNGCYFDPSPYNPTATFVFDLSVATQYTPPASLLYQQEASDATSLSDCRRRLCHSLV
jgi:hypothetical protein